MENRKILNINKYIFIISIALMLLPFGFYYYSICTISLLLMGLSIIIILSNIKYELHYYDIVYFIFIIMTIISIMATSKIVPYFNAKYRYVFGFYIYIYARMYFSYYKNEILIYHVIEVIASTYILIGLYQIINGMTPTCFYNNRNMYSCFLSFILPIYAINIYTNKKGDRLKITNILRMIMIILSIILIVITKSRTAIISVSIISILFVLLINQNIIKTIYKYIFLSFILLVTSCQFLYITFNGSLKTISILGRLLIAKVCFSIISKNFVSGIGVGKMDSMYNLYQAQYLAANNNQYLYKIAASDNYHSFNFILSIFTEMGVMGMTLIIIIFLITIYMIFRMYKNNINDCNYNINKILLYTIFIIVNFIIIGQFYIPYKDLNVIIIVNLTLAVLVNNGEFKSEVQRRPICT